MAVRWAFLALIVMTYVIATMASTVEQDDDSLVLLSNVQPSGQKGSSLPTPSSEWTNEPLHQVNTSSERVALWRGLVETFATGPDARWCAFPPLDCYVVLFRFFFLVLVFV
jgi:hypothetical protein